MIPVGYYPTGVAIAPDDSRLYVTNDEGAYDNSHSGTTTVSQGTLAIDGITSASTVPLRVWSYLGATVALGALGYAGYIIVRTLTTGIDVPGYASLMVAILFLGGLQLLSLGVLGEYVGRILTETKARPLYVVRETIGEA